MIDENASLRQTADQLGLTVSEPYRVGIGWHLDRLAMHLAIGRWKSASHRDWHGVRYTVKTMLKTMATCSRQRSWWGIWQCEGTISRYARRGLTARAAERRMLRDEISAALDGRWTR